MKLITDKTDIVRAKKIIRADAPEIGFSSIVYEMSQDPEKSEVQKAVMWNQGDDDQ